MKNYLIIFIFLFLIASQNRLIAETIEEKWPNGKVSKKYTTTNENKKSGVYTEFFENGQLKIKAFYINDLLDGYYYEHSDDGKKKLEAQYSKGQKNGFYRTFDKGVLVKEENWVEGFLAFPKSIAEITNSLANISKLKTEIVGDWPSDFKIERFTKTVEADNLAGMKRLREYRYLCGLAYEDLQIYKPYISCNLDALQVLSKLKYLSHTPPNPGLPAEIYQSGSKGTLNSNLSWGNFGMSTPLSIDIYMDDSDKTNIDRVGHRRWCLNPPMQKTGFALEGGYSAMWSVNNERIKTSPFDYICFPPRGYMPNTHFKNTTAWSITLNPKLYKTPDKTTIKIQVSSVKDSIKKELKISYQNIDTQYIGINNCIIFKPDNITVQAKSRYFVQISGLKDHTSKETTIEYYVEFF